MDNLVQIASNMSQEFRLPNRPSIPANQSLSQTPLNQQPASEYNSATSTPSPSMATGLKTKRSKKWRVLNADSRNLAAMPLKSSLIPAQGVQKDYIVTSSPITKEPIKEHV